MIGSVRSLCQAPERGHDTVDHAAPAGRQQHDGEHHAHGLRPVGQAGVVQMVGAGPHVHGDQRPEMHDRQPVGVDRALRLHRHVVIHHAEEAGGQEKAHRVMAVPPLHHGVDGAAVGGIGFGQRHRDGGAVDDMQQRDGDDEGAVEPVGHVNMTGAPPGDGGEEHHRVGHPHHRQEDVDGPFQLGVFLGAGEAQRQSDRRQHDHRLVAPEHKGGQAGKGEPGFTGALHHVQRGADQRAAAEGEDHRIGV